MNSFSVVCFGETLYDVTPAGTFPGGAPLNVAYHLNKLGVKTALISRVGMDKKLIEVVAAFGLSTAYIQIDHALPTGKVLAQLDANGDATYDIVHPVAWDHIEFLPALQPLVANAPYFLFGTLASRDKTTRNTLMQLLEMANIKVMDMNLRFPWYDRAFLHDCLCRTDILKLNIDELELISNHSTERDRIKAIRDRFNMKYIIVTRGRRGAIINHDDTFWEHPGFNVQVADTVGSGDAFTAAILSGLIQNKEMEEALEFANRIAAFVTSCQGACPDYDHSLKTKIQI